MPYTLDYLEELKKAESGDSNAQFNVASFLVWGDRAAPLNPQLAAVAIRYYSAAAGAGDTDSMLDLGAMYLEGRGVKKNTRTALRWYRRAARAGAPKAYRCLGNYYSYDRSEGGVPVQTKDRKRLRRALKCFTAGAELGEENSLYELGDYYRSGTLVEKNESLAFQCYLAAYDVIQKYVLPDAYANNDSYADVTLRLAECYHYGIGTEPDLERADSFIRIAVDACREQLAVGDGCAGASLARAEAELRAIQNER